MCLPSTGTDREEVQQLNVEAKKFFESFSKALEKQDAAEAVMHIAPKYRERFSKGYRFWRGTKLRALKVIGLPDKEGVLRVKTQIVSPAGRKDTETRNCCARKTSGFCWRADPTKPCVSQSEG